MKNTTYIEDIAQFNGKEVTISGWLYNMRSSGKLKFLMVRDGTGLIQAVVFKNDVDEKVFELCEQLTQETSSSWTYHLIVLLSCLFYFPDSCYMA